MEDEMRKSYLFFICIAFTFAPSAWGDDIEPGNTYHIFQYRANIREKPNRNSKVLAILNFGDQVEVVEDTENGEEINDVWGYWYKVKYGRITGYTFGGNLAVGTKIIDIDKNGVDDYFCYRFSRQYHDYRLNPAVDIKIRINNSEVSMNEFSKTGEYGFFTCYFIDRQNYVLIKLAVYRKYHIDHLMYKVYPDGEIQFIEVLEQGEYNPDEY
jgi:hypothetical protein